MLANLANPYFPCYEQGMGMNQKNSQTKEKIDDVERIKRVAFWYWEYMRRNTLYRRYCDTINKYNEYFKKIDVYDYMQSKEYLDEMTEYVSIHDEKEDLKNTPFRKYLEKHHGKKAGLIFFKYGFLANGYDIKFGRIYKYYSLGLNSYDAFENLLNGNIVKFSTDDIADISAISKLNKNWSITIEDEDPSLFYFDYQKFDNIKIKPEALLNDPSRIGLEAHALHLNNKAVNSLFEKQNIDTDTLSSVYKLSLAGKHINSSDVMRLAMLWIWDQASEHDKQNSREFFEVYPSLKAKIEEYSMADGVWEEILTRKARVAGYYQATKNCIQNLTVTPLGIKSA